ncbi:MAG: FGGY-family carbohydrate kinase [Rubrobacteraceae bacterium]
MSRYLLGIDSGLTVTKAVIFDEEGRQRGVGSVNNVHGSPHPRWVQQDMKAVWEGCERAIRQALKEAKITGKEVVSIGITGHGDGVYLVDEKGAPTAPAILSLDSRAEDILQSWRDSGVAGELTRLTGQRPFAAQSPPILAWFKENDPEVLEKTRQLLYVKDWLRYKLTGEYATDPTDASGGFTDIHTQDYSQETFPLYGLEDFREKLPPMVGCMEVSGEVSAKAAESTGLSAGTPVVGGAHDIDAAAIGVGCIAPGTLVAIAGTWSNNEVVSEEVTPGDGWLCRSFVTPGRWLNISGSPASSANLEWFVRQLCPEEVKQAQKRGASPFDFVNEEVEAVLDEKSAVFYHPFLYGSPHGSEASAGFFGVRGWHKRGHLLRAILEGSVFNHKTHIEALRAGFEFGRVRLTGGGSKSGLWSQMLADAVGFPVEVTDAEEAGALGAAVLAGVGVGVYGSLEEAAGRSVRLLRTHEPEPGANGRLVEAYETYTALVDALEPIWPRLG